MRFLKISTINHFFLFKKVSTHYEIYLSQVRFKSGLQKIVYTLVRIGDKKLGFEENLFNV